MIMQVKDVEVKDVQVNNDEEVNNDVTVDSSNNILPLMYKNPNDTDGYWLCDYDDDKKITSVFIGHEEKYIAYMPSPNDALKQEEMLVNDGWVKCKKPEVTFSMIEKSLPRKYRRKMEKQRKKEEKKEASLRNEKDKRTQE